MTLNWRLIAAAVAAVVLFATGWMVRGWMADADMNATLLAHEQERVQRIEAANRVVTAAEQSGRETVAKYEARIREISNVSQKLKTEVIHAQSQAISSNAPVCSMPSSWVRLYDDALRPSGGADSRTGDSGAASEGTGAAGSGPASEWDVLWVHTENAARWAECRAQLNGLIDFEKRDDASVVTQESPQN